jgi:hypothetical protein
MVDEIPRRATLRASFGIGRCFTDELTIALFVALWTAAARRPAPPRHVVFDHIGSPRDRPGNTMRVKRVTAQLRIGNARFPNAEKAPARCLSLRLLNYGCLRFCG